MKLKKDKSEFKSVKKQQITEFKAVLLREINGTPYKIDEKKIKSDAEKIEFKDATFPIPDSNLVVNYIDKKCGVLYFDLDGNILTFNKTKIPIDIKWLNLYITRNIISETFNRMRKPFESMGLGSKLGTYIIVACAFGFLGYIIGKGAF